MPKGKEDFYSGPQGESESRDEGERWADQAEQGEDMFWDENQSGERVISQEKQPDGSILKTVVEYTTNDKGQTVKVVKKVRQHKVPIKINKRVEARRKWRKFGDCYGKPPGIEPGVTSQSLDEVFLELTDQAKKEIEPSLDNQKKKELLSFMVCRICGKIGDHWTLNCPFKGKITANNERQTQGGKEGGDGGPPSRGGPGKYVPPGKYGRQGSELGAKDRVEATLRVSNLSEEARDSDVSELFRPFGPVSRIYLAKDKVGKSKGFAFVTFIHREHAEKALQKLNGFGYDYLILHVEWAKPSRD